MHFYFYDLYARLDFVEKRCLFLLAVCHALLYPAQYLFYLVQVVVLDKISAPILPYHHQDSKQRQRQQT